jgi:uncharacterized protein YegJ (DUF2314 family)
MSVRSWLRQLFGERQPQPLSWPRKPLIALVWLRRTPRDLAAADLADLAADALGEPYTSGDPEATDYFITGCAPSFLLKRGGQTYLVHTFPRPYMDDPGAVAARAGDRQLKRAIANHEAWLSVDLLGDVPSGELEEVYRVIGRLMAALADNDCVALYCPEADRLSAPDAGLMAKLRGEWPPDLFEQPFFPSPGVPDTDPRMRAAVTEARRRWPEFVADFEGRQPGQSFAVKAKVMEPDGPSEYVWLAVTALEGDGIYGILDNEPVLLRHRHRGDRARVLVSSLQDWLCFDGAKGAGGFTIAVLQQILREQS